MRGGHSLNFQAKLASARSESLASWYGQPWALPTHVLPIPDDLFACDSQYEPVPLRNVYLFTVNLLDHRDPVTEHCHAVALFQSALLLAADVIFLARVDEVVQPCRIEA
jgi:hypothetical protein